MRTRLCLVLAAVGIASCQASQSEDLPDRSTGSAVTAPTPTTQQAPLYFEANQGQTDPRADFVARGSNYSLFLTRDAAWFVLSSAGTSVAIRNSLEGASHVGGPVGEQLGSGISNYFIGNVPAQWHTGIPQYAGVRYPSVYPGIDLRYQRGADGGLETEFDVAAGADPAPIAMDFAGALSVGLDTAGNLVATTPIGDLIQRQPIAYQMKQGRKVSVPCAFRLSSPSSAGFTVGPHDTSLPVTIDPSVTLGGVFLTTSTDTHAVALLSGNYYVAGETTSSSFPTTTGAFKTSTQGGTDGFVAKITDPRLGGTGEIVYATYFGGSGTDIVHGIAVDQRSRYSMRGRQPSAAAAMRSSRS